MMWHERPENAGKVERLRKMFKNTPNDVIIEKLDISFSTLHRTARALGLTKYDTELPDRHAEFPAAHHHRQEQDDAR